MRGPVGLWALVLAALASSVALALQLRPLVGALRSVPATSLHEVRVRLQERLVAVSGALVAVVPLLIVALMTRDANRYVVENHHALEALGTALLILGLALFIAAFFLFPPFGLAMTTAGTLALVSTLTPAFGVMVGGSVVLSGLGVLLSEAAGDGSSSSGESSGSTGGFSDVARRQRIEELARDPANGGKITPSSCAEAEVGVGPETPLIAAHLLWRRTDGAQGARLDAVGLDLAGARLAGADLADAVLVRADLRGADLRGADLAYAALTGADLSGADLTGAQLAKADLVGAKLRAGRLRAAQLVRTDVASADLTQADLSRAYLLRTYLAKADLRGADLTEADLDRAVVDGATWGGNAARDAAGTIALGAATLAGDPPSAVTADGLVAYLAAAGARVTAVDPDDRRPDEPLPWRWRPA